MDFASQITQAGELFHVGKFAEAAAIFKRLCEQGDLNRTGRMIAAANLARTYDKMGHPEHAVATYAYCVSVASEDYVFAQQERANYFLEQRRFDEAISIWQALLDLEFLPADRAEAIRQNLDIALGQRG